MLKSRRTAVFLSLLLILLAAQEMRARQVYAVDLAGYVPGQVVVRLDQGADIAAINQDYGTAVLSSIPGQPAIFLLQAPPGANLLDLVMLLAGDPRLAYAELNYLTADPESGSTNRIYGWGDQGGFTNQHTKLKMNLGGAHGFSSGAGAVIAILDTGVQADHPELSPWLSPFGFDFVDGDSDPSEEANGLDDDLDGQIDEGYGHGTHVTGIVHLVAPEATLLPLRVLNSDSRGNTFKTAAAVFYAAAHGADVINLSLGSPERSLVLSEAVAEAAGLGAVVVAAAGNANSSLEQYPAAESCAVSVTSVRIDNKKKSSFASYGAWVDLSAPGEAIMSTFPVDGYASTSGTSMAAPFVSGQAALLRSLSPGLTLNEIGLLLGGTVQPVNDFFYQGQLGKGLIDVTASLQSLAAGTTQPAGSNVLSGCTGG